VVGGGEDWLWRGEKKTSAEESGEGPKSAFICG
jgi:hypothetical protein